MTFVLQCLFMLFEVYLLNVFDNSVEMFPVGPATGLTLRAADVGWVGSHSTPLSTNKFLEAFSEGVCGPDGRCCSHHSSEYVTVRRAPPRMRPFRST